MLAGFGPLCISALPSSIQSRFSLAVAVADVSSIYFNNVSRKREKITLSLPLLISLPFSVLMWKTSAMLYNSMLHAPITQKIWYIGIGILTCMIKWTPPFFLYSFIHSWFDTCTLFSTWIWPYVFVGCFSFRLFNFDLLNENVRVQENTIRCDPILILQFELCFDCSIKCAWHAHRPTII